MEEKVKYFVKANFGERVVCLLFYGSQAFGGMSSKNTDYDFLLVLDKPDIRDFQIIKKCIDADMSIDITIQYKSRIDARGINFFQQGNHGTFFLKCLAQARCLIGKNLFLENMHLVSKKTEFFSLLFQCEEYFFRLQVFYYKMNEVDWVEQARKYLSRIMVDMLLLTEDFSYEDVSRVSRDDFINIKVANGSCFSIATVKSSKSILRSNSESRSELLLLYNHLYEDYLKQYAAYQASF